MCKRIKFFQKSSSSKAIHRGILWMSLNFSFICCYSTYHKSFKEQTLRTISVITIFSKVFLLFVGSQLLNLFLPMTILENGNNIYPPRDVGNNTRDIIPSRVGLQWPAHWFVFVPHVVRNDTLRLIRTWQCIKFSFKIVEPLSLCFPTNVVLNTPPPPFSLYQ